MFRGSRVVMGVILIWCLALPVGLAGAAAESLKEQTVKVYMDKKEIPFPVLPEVVEDSTLVPFRTIFEALGLTVSWEPDTQTAIGTKEKFEIRLQIGEARAQLNGRTVELAAAPRILHEMTFVPLRFVGEATGRDVLWNGEAQEININSSLTSYMYEALYSSAMEYKGEKAGAVPHGQGQYWYKGKLWYEGQFVNGMMEGKGKWLDPENEKSYYEGQFHANRIEGAGKMAYNSGNYYVGPFVNGKREGTGKTYYANGKLQYEGEFRNDSRNGQGTYRASDDYYLTGTFMNGSITNGKEYSKGVLSYDGNFTDGQKGPSGTLYHSNGKTWYTGGFVKGAPEGYGKFFDKDGKLEYTGDVIHYERTGKGTLYANSAITYEGEVYKGKPDGAGIQYDGQGKVTAEGFFYMGKLQSNPESFKQSQEYRIHLLEKQLTYEVIDGINVKDGSLTPQEAVLNLQLKDEQDLKTFQELSNAQRKAVLNGFAQSHWGDVIGVKKCYVHLYYKGKQYAAVTTAYQNSNETVEMIYYPDGAK